MALRTVGGGKYVVQTGTTAAPTPNYAQQLHDIKKRSETRESQGAGAQELSGYGASADKIRSLMGVGKDDAKYGAQANAADIYKLMHPEKTDAGPTQPAGPPQPATPSQPSQPSTGFINSIYDNQQAAQMQKLREARDVALQQLNKIQTGAEQSAYDNRNSADSAYNQNAKKISELMANNGTMQSGDMTSASSNLMASRQGEIGSINRGLGNTLTDVNERRGLINNNAMGDEQSLLQTIEAARSGALLNDYYHNDDKALKIAELMGYMDNNGQRTQTLAGRNSDQNYQLGLGGLTGNIGGQKTVQQKQLDWNMDPSNPNNEGQIISNEISKLKLQNLPQELKANLDLLDQQVKTGAVGLQEANYKLKEMTDPNSVTNQAKAIDLELGKINLANAPQEAKLRIQQMQKEIAEIGKAPYRSPEQIDMDKVKLATMNEELSQLKNPPAQPQSGPSKIDSKTSTDNYNIIYGDLQTQGVTKDQARKLVEANRDYLTDSDYRKLMDDINANF